MNKKRILFTGDYHCGHRAGLTHPKYQSAILGDKYHKLQMENWETFLNMIHDLHPDIHVCGGDAIDGGGQRSAGTELLTTDVNKQCEMAEEVFKTIDPERQMIHRMVRGTPYHSSPNGQDAEDIICKNLKHEGYQIKVEDHAWLDVNGVVFDIKHKVGSAEMYKSTAITKQKLANMLWSEMSSQPKAQVFIRFHVHNYHIEDNFTWVGGTMPALQGAASKFGARQCSFPVHFGVVWFDVYDKENFGWNKSIITVDSQKATAEKL